jgi:hypothetical protein
MALVGLAKHVSLFIRLTSIVPRNFRKEQSMSVSNYPTPQPDTTIRHYSLIHMAQAALDDARLNYASAFEAYMKNRTVETAKAAFNADQAYRKAQADYDQVRISFKQLRMQRVSA